MNKNWKSSCFRDPVFLLALCLLFQNFSCCCSLNEEGKVLLKFKQGIVRDPFGALSNWVNDEVAVNHCNWFGVECSAGRVVVLNLKDLCLEGNLVPELANLVHIKSIILRNNSFYGIIPEGIAHLNELEVLDLGYNNFSGHLPKDLGNNISLTILLLDNNDHLCGFSPEINKLKMISEYQVDERRLSMAGKVPACTRRFIKRHIDKNKKGSRRLLQFLPRGGVSPFDRTATFPDSPAPSPSAPSLAPATPPVEKPASADRNDSASTSPSPLPEPSSAPPSKSNSSNNNLVRILAGVIGGFAFVVISIIGIYLWKTNKVATVKPWATGLSGQLQKAFVTGVPKLKRSELEAACEDFSNVIGTSSLGTVYKGTLSSGVEIAVASVAVTESKDWSKTLEAQFRKKIDTLSKVNHKNFVNLLGHCEEDEPFTRMVVFEYAPNGTLFEHLHIKEAEHLDWETRQPLPLFLPLTPQPPLSYIYLKQSLSCSSHFHHSTTFSSLFHKMPNQDICSHLKEPRLVTRKFLARPQHEGVGAVVRRSIGRFELKNFDPFLVLDEFSVTAPAGFPDHPHRGFETVTYMLQGAITHEDFEGRKGTIEAGDLQWMTAGRGIVHSEMPAAQGTQKGLQLWINLSSKHKMIEPRYQEMLSKDIAETMIDGIKVRVIAGEALGIKSPIYTRTPTMYLDFSLKPGAHLQQPIPKSWNAFVYILEGEGVFGNQKSQPVNSHHILLLGSGDGLEAWNKSSKVLRFILVGGEPLGEPVVQYGPFVMNTQEEIDQTIDDYENYTNGFEKARHWRSESALSLDY